VVQRVKCVSLCLSLSLSLYTNIFFFYILPHPYLWHIYESDTFWYMGFLTSINSKDESYTQNDKFMSQVPNVKTAYWYRWNIICCQWRDINVNNRLYVVLILTVFYIFFFIYSFIQSSYMGPWPTGYRTCQNLCHINKAKYLCIKYNTFHILEIKIYMQTTSTY